MPESDSEWFKEWFNKDYVELYSNRDATEATAQVAFLLSLQELTPFKDQLTILDVACGTGRHLSALLNRTNNAYGIDLSKSLLELSSNALAGRLLVADMRQLPLINNSINLITSFFTSFGYFKSSDDELRVLTNFNRILTENGLVFFDLANKQFVIDSLVPEESLKYSHGTADIKREINNINGQTRVTKSITMRKTDGLIVMNKEDVKLFDENELCAILQSAGFKPVRTFGSFAGEDYCTTSKRLILLAEKI